MHRWPPAALIVAGVFTITSGEDVLRILAPPMDPHTTAIDWRLLAVGLCLSLALRLYRARRRILAAQS